MNTRICEDCDKTKVLGYKSLDKQHQYVCLDCRDAYPEATSWLLDDTCRGCGIGEKYCTCEAYVP